jgi:hypothetical protein
MTSSMPKAASRNRSFADILDDLDATAEEADRVAPARATRQASGPDWLSSLFGRDRAQPQPDRVAVESAFFFDDEELVPEAANEPLSFDLDEDRIAAELGLASATTTAELQQARRAFARRYHPDLFDGDFKAKANARMQLANMLIDRRRKDIEGKR